MSDLFGFESDFVDSLRCIPMAARYRLDLSGVKLKLNEWSKLDQAARRALVEGPCGTPEEIDAYRETVSARVAGACGHRPSLLPDPVDRQWEAATVPAQVREKAAAEGIALGDSAWKSLTVLQRFALIKLSRPGHENLNFRPAAREFGLVPSHP
jgi:hypothetical protein